MLLRSSLMGIVLTAAALGSAPAKAASASIGYVAYCTDQEMGSIALPQAGIALLDMESDRYGVQRATNLAEVVPSCTAIAVPYDTISLTLSRLSCSAWNRRQCETAESVDAAVASLRGRFPVGSSETYRFQTERSEARDCNYTILILRPGRTASIPPAPVNPPIAPPPIATSTSVSAGFSAVGNGTMSGAQGAGPAAPGARGLATVSADAFCRRPGREASRVAACNAALGR